MKHVYVPETPFGEILAPNGGQTWRQGEQHEIKWIANDDVAITSVDIYYSTNGGTDWTPIATGETHDGYYTWTVPSVESTTCQIKVVVHDGDTNTYEDTSDANFTIAPPLPPPVVYDFTDITNPSGSHKAEDGEIDCTDSMIENGTFPARRDSINGWNNWGEASTAEYAALVGSDDSRYQGADPGSGDNAAMIFEFYVDEDPVDVEQIDVSVELGRNSSTDLGWVYIWNYNTSSYLVLGSQNGTADQVISASVTTNPGDYINSSTGQLTVFAVNEDVSDWIRIDDISVTIYAQTGVAPPGQAVNLSPADAATDVAIDNDLSWTAGSGATSHDVYFGTTSPGDFIGNQTDTTFDTGTMTNDTTYYWRIDEKNVGGTTTGTVWSFTTVGVPPTIISTAVTEATVSQPYYYDVDANGIPAPTYALTTKPTGMTINSTTGEINWTPGANQSGLNHVDVQATNTEGTDIQGFDINVIALPSDNFDDNRRGATWRLSQDDYEKVRVVEDANRLNLSSIGTVNLTSCCVGHWKMNDNDGQVQVDDNSSNGNHGTAQQITSNLHTDSGNPPNLNGAFTFNGSGDHIDLGGLIVTGAYTKAAWVKRASGTFVNNIISADTFSHAFFAPSGYSFKLSAGHNGTWNHVQDTVALTADTWHFVAVTFDPDVGLGTMVLYKDGAEVGSATSVPTQSGSTNTYIGKFESGYYFAGAMDNAMLFNRALTADEIEFLYNEGNGTETIAENDSHQAVYVANGWSFDATEDFAVEVDFHYDSISDANGWAGIDVADEANYVSISAGSDSDQRYFYYEAIIDGNMVLERELRDSNDGTLYLSYNANLNEVYLSHTGYGSGNAYVWQTIVGPLQGQWSSAVDVAVGGGSEGVALGSGEAYLDDFETTTAAPLSWPPATDLDEDGFIGWGDVAVLSQYWLGTGPEGDVNKDTIVNFPDLAEIGLAW